MKVLGWAAGLDKYSQPTGKAHRIDAWAGRGYVPDAACGPRVHFRSDAIVADPKEAAPEICGRCARIEARHPAKAGAA